MQRRMKCRKLEPDRFAEAYLHTPVQKIRTYSLAQFDHWTKEPFSSNFRKMLTLEQYRDPKPAQLHHDYLAGGPLEYMAAIFRKLVDSDEDAMQLALEILDGPMHPSIQCLRRCRGKRIGFFFTGYIYSSL